MGYGEGVGGQLSETRLKTVTADVAGRGSQHIQ